MSEIDLNNLAGHTTRLTKIKKGLYEKDKQDVICPTCNNHLTTIVTIDDADVSLNHIVVCPCGEETFQFHTEGNYVYDTQDGYFPLDIKMKNGLVKLELGKK